jgi:hypothetical protein
LLISLIETVGHALWFAVQCAGLLLLADFIGGLFHWSEDTLGREDTPIWGAAFVRPNVIHHDTPGYMNTIPWMKNNASSAIALVVMLALFGAFGLLYWQVVFLFCATALNQQAHRFSHAATVRLPPPIRWLQRARVLQEGRHHWKHHTEPHLTCYCVMTPWVNPVLDRLGFWRGMERVLAPVFGAPRRPDLVARPWYPARHLPHDQSISRKT